MKKQPLKSTHTKSVLLLVFLQLLGFTNPTFISAQSPTDKIIIYPSNEKNINPDTRLRLTFSETPMLNSAGEIRIYDASNDELIDLLDLSIPPGPKNTRTPAPYDSLVYKNHSNILYTHKNRDTVSSHVYQKNYIGGNSEADAYHFYPVLIDGNTATINLHNNKLTYNKTYYVRIDSEVFSLENGVFNGYNDKNEWTFSTKKSSPSLEISKLIVSSDGTGDFNTVQGAIDFIPNDNPNRKTIYIKNGRYEEIVYFRNKENISIIGEHRDKVLVCYANNAIFNNKPLKRNTELSYHNRRAVFALNKSSGIHIANMTIRSLGEKPAQAEALLTKGEKIIVSHVNIEGSGDALQATGNIYITDSKIQGFGDNVLGYGAVFFKNCDFVSSYGPHMWIRNSDANHGNVCVDCTFRTIGDVETTIARTNDNRGDGFPFCEAVLINCAMEGVKPEGWSVKGKGISDIHYWEYNSTNISDGKPVDTSKRDPISRQLNTEKDAELIKNYMNPSYVLNGWEPAMIPFIISQPQSVTAKKGDEVKFEVISASIQDVTYQWFKNNELIKGATQKEMIIKKSNNKDVASYSVLIKNDLGFIKSENVDLKME